MCRVVHDSYTHTHTDIRVCWVECMTEITKQKTCPNCEDQDCEIDMDLCEGCERCKTCFGTGIQEYQIAVDDFREMGCEDCGYDPNDDPDAYDVWRDDQLTESKDD